jgi:phosphohistidine phosphatase
MATHRTLIVLRHAKSDQHLGLPDLDRPLNDRGRQQAPEAGTWLALQWLGAHGGSIDLAIVSTAVRTRETWDLVSAQLDPPPPSRFEEVVYNAPLEALVQVVAELPDDAATVLLVGHNPGVSEVVHELTGEQVEMPTAAIAVIALPSDWSSIAPNCGRLLRTHRP